MEKVFQLFLREKKFVNNVSSHTIEFYEYSFNSFKKYSSVKDISDLSKSSLIEFVANMLEQGSTAQCADARVRGINPFLTWLYENEYTNEHFKIKRVKFQKRIMKTFTDAHVKAIINYKPKDFYERRLHTILLLLLVVVFE